MGSLKVRSGFLELLLLVAIAAASSSAEEANYLIGRGMFDMTGPAGEIDFMGYANPAQSGAGIHLRQYARAFIITDRATQKTTLFVSIDACMTSHVVTGKVLHELAGMYGDTYVADNVIISGTHTHSTPAGFFQYVLYDITSVGVVTQTIDAYVYGIVQAVKIAHESMQPGYILMNSGVLLNASRNRSPTSYLSNPAEERALYEHDTDKLMTVLKLVNADGKGLGMINWFAVHCTSMNNTNRLISSDNKGYASILFEESIDEGTLPGQGEFVAAFAATNLGDVSPNTRGAHCIDTGESCEANHSTCGGRTEKCIASGPGKDMTDSTRIIGVLQYEKAKELYNGATTKLEGPIDVRHSYIDMTAQTVHYNGTQGKTCKAAMGYSFAAGTTDGPGAFDFTQGSKHGNPFWNGVSGLLAKPSEEQVACQHPKPILLDTGEMKEPFAWQPSVVPIQMVRIGQLVILAVPGEFTTMSGRRIRKAIKKRLVSQGWSENITVVISGLSGMYSSYITTFEEYQDQRYEAASTIFGPHTLQAYIENFERLATDMVKGTVSRSLPMPLVNDHVINTFDYPFPVVWDSVPFGAKMGGVIEEVNPTYTGGDVISVSFHAGDPRNNLMTNQSFLTVERETSPNHWQIVAQDSSWHTEFHWSKPNRLDTHSTATIVWRTQADTTVGTYRIRHFGFYHPLAESPKPYSGSSKVFKILA